MELICPHDQIEAGPGFALATPVAECCEYPAEGENGTIAATHLPVLHPKKSPPPQGFFW